MATLDHQMVVLDSVSIADSAGASIIGYLDLTSGNARKDAFDNTTTDMWGEQDGLCWNIICEDEDFASSGAATVTLELITANDASLSSGAVTLLTQSGIGITPNDGDTIARKPLPAARMLRYLGVKLTVGVAATTAGKVTSWIGPLLETPLAPTDLKK